MWRNSAHKAEMTAISLRCASRLAMLLVLACTSALALAQTLRIGVAAPLSGDIEHLGQGIVQGAKMAVDDINASGGVRVGTRRIKLELIVADDKADPRTAVEVAQRLISDGAVAVVGHLNSGCSIPAAHLYGAGRVVQISPSSSNPLYTALKLDTAFRVVANDRRQAEVMAFYAARTLGIKTVAVLTDDTTYGDILTSAFANAADLLGVRVLFQGAIPEAVPNIDQALAMIKAIGPDAVYFGGMDLHAAQISSALHGLGIKTHLLLGDGACSKQFITAAKESAANPMYCSNGDIELSTLPKGSEFAVRFKKRYGTDPTVYAPYAHDALQAIAHAIASAGTTDREKVIRAMRRVTLTGVTGQIGFDANGDLIDAPISIFTNRGGELAFVVNQR